MGSYREISASLSAVSGVFELPISQPHWLHKCLYCYLRRKQRDMLTVCFNRGPSSRKPKLKKYFPIFAVFFRSEVWDVRLWVSMLFFEPRSTFKARRSPNAVKWRKGKGGGGWQTKSQKVFASCKFIANIESWRSSVGLTRPNADLLPSSKPNFLYLDFLKWYVW